MTCGVYAIINTVNDKLYIGSSINIEARWAVHKSGLKRGNGSKHLQRAWNLYGNSIFEFVILEECEKEERRQKEAEWFEKYDWDRLYNISRKTTGGTGYLSEDARKRIGEATSKRTKGIMLSEEHKAKIGNAQRGRAFSQEQRVKIGDSKRGRKLSESHRVKISQSLVGNKRRTGKVPWNKKEKDNV